ncbi:hypothetical protein [Actinomadura chokoriensis]|uniref:DUF397 domain-containing protein n=1 Tax=Actinomadura chokoriensis TaxID=454156 RepID=A0ABV4QSG3_9ACTN
MGICNKWSLGAPPGVADDLPLSVFVKESHFAKEMTVEGLDSTVVADAAGLRQFDAWGG